jgi:succinate dehydrogenase / fumarate reductase flavoprotein subunit
MIGGPSAVRYARGLETRAADEPASLFEAAEKEWAGRFGALRKMSGPENPYGLHQELGRLMSDHAGIVRENGALKEAEGKLRDLKARYQKLAVPDQAAWTNNALAFTQQLWNMLELGHLVLAGALARDESRGAHYKQAFPKRNDATWLKTTIANWTEEGPRLSYEPVDTSILKPVERKYT